jgi:hypothetical protein
LLVYIKMNNQEFLDFIINIEEKDKVERLHYKNMHLWPIVRCYLFKAFVTNQDNNYVPTLSFFKKLISHTWHSIKDFKKFLNPFKKYDLCFFGTGLSKSKFNDKFYDYLLEPIIEKYEAKKQTALFLERNLYLKYPKNRPSFFTSFIDNLAVLFSYLLAPFIRLDYVNISDLNLSSIVKLKRYIAAVYILGKFYSIVLTISQPKKIYMTSYYSLTGLAMCYAGWLKNIPVIEVQHGNIYNNFAYLGWNKVPSQGYNTLPNKYLFWHNIDTQFFNIQNSKNFIQRHKAVTYGIPWLKFWQSKDRTVLYYNHLLQQALKNYKVSVIVTLRPDIFNNNEWNKLIPVIRETESSIFWFIRKHPTMLQSQHESLKEICNLNCKNVDYEYASSFPLYSLLNIVQLHITTASNVAAEALSFNVPSLFISSLAEKEMPHLVACKGNKVITEPKLILEALYEL